MTKYENRSLFVSLLSLALSIVLPVISYYKFNNDFPPVGERPQIEIEKSTQDSGEIEGGRDYCKYYQYDIIVRNTGKRPARQVDMNVKRFKEFDDPRAPQDYGSITIKTDPPVGDNIKQLNNAVYMRITQPIGSKEELKIQLIATQVPITSVCFVTEYGDRTCQEYKEKT